MKTKSLHYFFPIIFLFLLTPLGAFAGEWQVIPIRLDFDKGNKSGTLTIKNRSDDSLNMQLKGVEWTQDAEGKDVYLETSDLIFLPKIATIEKEGEQVVRAGIKVPATAKEKTYRLFVQEMPKPRKTEGASIALALRFGVPVFVKPLKEEVKGTMTKPEVAKGVFSTTVRNAGNVHFNITAINLRLLNAKQEEVFSKELKGWYLLAGASRLYTIQVPKESCVGASVAELDVKTDKLNLHERLPITQTMCEP